MTPDSDEKITPLQKSNEKPIKNKEIISRMYNPKDVKVGDKIDFQIDPNKVHFFDAETEKAIF